MVKYFMEENIEKRKLERGSILTTITETETVEVTNQERLEIRSTTFTNYNIYTYKINKLIGELQYCSRVNF